MHEKKIKKLKETKEENIILKNKKRNNINSFGCNNSSAFDTCWSKYEFNTR